MTTHKFDSAGFGTDALLQAAVGRVYNCGLSDGVRRYGYLFEPVAGKDGGFHWKTDTAAKDALIAYSSSQLIDRDLAFFPRVTDGDFSGGGYQEVFIDTKRFFDSDLDPRVPGYLQLRALWARVSKAALTVGSNFQTVAFNGDLWFTFGEANGHVYSANGATTTTPTAAAILSLDTDGSFLYAGTAGGLWRSADGVTWTAVTSSINGTASMWWVVNQGTNGYFAYYQHGTNLLNKIDLTQAFPIAAAAQPQIPVGANAINIVDLVEYQTSIAILTTDVRGSGSDVWYFDGNNLTRIIRMEGYHAHGMTVCLGALYVSLHDHTGGTSPLLAKVDSGSFTVVARPGSPFPTTVNQSCMGPCSGGQYVYWPILNPSIKGISSAPGVVIQYDTVTGAVSHLPNLDATDFTSTGSNTLRSVAAIGDSVAICYVNGTTGVLQYQTSAFATITYSPTGWLASSLLDFGTPGIGKRFKRLEVHHSPLNAGEAIFLEAFVDQDPLSFTTALAPVPPAQSGGSLANGGALNSVVGSTTTALLLSQDTVGKTLYFAIKLTAGTANATTPRVSYVTVEVGGTWVVDLNLACTSRRQTLSQEADTQGATGSDLAYLLYLAQENGTLLTFFHPNGQSYTMAIESLDGWNPSLFKSQVNRPQDEEYVVHAILRQAA